MGILDKEAYWGKMMYAEERNAKSREKGAENGLTDEQADALESMARARHNMHTNIDSLVRSSESRNCERDLIRANAKLREAGLPTVPSIPSYEGDYIDIDDLDFIIYELAEEYNMPDRDEEEEKWQSWYDEIYSKLYDEWEALNDKIENYLGKIDEKYKTSYRPTGATRFSYATETNITDNNDNIESSVKDITNRFNVELQQQIDGTLPKGYVYSLGMPGDILRSAGLPNLPIEMSSFRLIHKSNQENHPFELKEIKNLPAW